MSTCLAPTTPRAPTRRRIPDAAREPRHAEKLSTAADAEAALRGRGARAGSAGLQQRRRQRAASPTRATVIYGVITAPLTPLASLQIHKFKNMHAGERGYALLWPLRKKHTVEFKTRCISRQTPCDLSYRCNNRCKGKLSSGKTSAELERPAPSGFCPLGGPPRSRVQ